MKEGMDMLFGEEKNEMFLSDFLKGQRLRHTIDTKGYKYTDFADLSGIAPSTLSRFMAGSQSMSDRYIRLAAELLGVSVEYLEGKSEITNPIVSDSTHSNVREQQLSFSTLSNFMTTIGVRYEWKASFGGDTYIKLQNNNWQSTSVKGLELTEQKLIDELNVASAPKAMWVELTYHGHTKKMSYDSYQLWMKSIVNSVELRLQDVFSVYSDLSMKVYETEIDKAINHQG